MLKIQFSAAFKKDYKRLKKRGYNLAVLDHAIAIIASGEKLPESYRDHALVGNYIGCHECHIASDWLLVYEIIENNLILYLTRTGTHSDIFS